MSKESGEDSESDYQDDDQEKSESPDPKSDGSSESKSKNKDKHKRGNDGLYNSALIPETSDSLSEHSSKSSISSETWQDTGVRIGFWLALLHFDFMSKFKDRKGLIKLLQLLFGFLLLFFGCALVFWNERSYTIEKDTIEKTRNQIVIAPEFPTQSNNGKLIYLTGTIKTQIPIVDETTDFISTNAVEMQRIVEVFDFPTSTSLNKDGSKASVPKEEKYVPYVLLII